ncbi:c-type cytochrome biogenesis protein CcmI [Rhizobium sp. SL86]|uniref:c-type cytochrome biogenesis protein CcmI n=1 Tax=Rhizobium sp. SL86 TaxID=2995148 RepID=UPI0022761757|nr:c-type cytochrome biogenesis protein CcmI [Rhizobium sp. SL86]MCY1664156.1 c-type cytochrome biogenesis protein CcmI [Rhizobium sp. SL86]
MVLWIVLAVLTAVVAAVLIAPLMKARQPVLAGPEDGAAVYRDQLREIDRDLSEGLIGAQEADYARAEIGRRLLAIAGKSDATDASVVKAGPGGRHRLALSAILLCLPAVGLCLYLMLGSPGLPDQPLEARLANPGNNIALLIAKAERHLAQNPNDGAGWDLLAPIYFRSQRLADAENAYRRAIALLGESPERLAGLGETLVAGRDGVVTADALAAFERAVALNRNNMRARFYVALGLEQAGRTPEALKAFQAIAADSPPGAAWTQLVAEHIAKNGGAPAAATKAPGNPGADDIAAAQQLSATDRQQMIAGMVESLAARLKDDPNNIEGWLRLVRSYKVLGRDESAGEALKTGLKTFPPTGEEGRRLLALAREMGLSLEGISQ